MNVVTFIHICNKLRFVSVCVDIVRLACVIRYHGQKILHGLMMHEDFDQMMTRNVPPDTLHSISDKLESLKRKVQVIVLLT